MMEEAPRVPGETIKTIGSWSCGCFLYFLPGACFIQFMMFTSFLSHIWLFKLQPPHQLGRSGSFLCGVCMFSSYLCGFTLGASVSQSKNMQDAFFKIKIQKLFFTHTLFSKTSAMILKSCMGSILFSQWNMM